MSSTWLSTPPFLPASLKGLKTAPKLHLYTRGTPNGYKASILLEELILAYPQLARTKLSYDIFYLSFDKKEQKAPEFLAINPNGRIPALVDDNVQVDGSGHAVFESASILLWLVENYDGQNKFWFDDPVERSKAFSWMFFGHGGIGPMQGQANHFVRYAPEKIPYGIKRYTDETKRLYSVLEDNFNSTGGEWIVGGKYSIVDMSIFGWVRRHSWAGVDDMAPYPRLQAWLDRIHARPGVDAGLAVPEKAKVQMTPEEEEKEAKSTSTWVMGGQPK